MRKQITKIAEGLLILEKYDESGFGTCVEHDQIWAGPDDAKSVSEEDAARLTALDWSIDEEGARRWSFYV